MSPHQIIAVAVRLFSVWLAVTALLNIPYYYLNAGGQSSSDAIWFFWPIVLPLILIAVGLWHFPLTIADKLLSSPESKVIEEASPDLWLSMGCALIGLFFIATTVPSLLVGLLQNRETLLSHLAGNFQYWLANELLRLAIGVWLVTGAKGFRKLFWWVRSAGLRPRPNVREDSPPD
jgi:hypothetical protein